MAINKLEGITGEIVVINYGGNWYGIPLTALVQIAAVQARYGLNTTRSKLLQSEIYALSPDAEQAIADMVVELRRRISQINSDFIYGLKTLIDYNDSQFTALLASSLIP